MQGTIKIAKALQNISTLTKLYIDNNNITDEAADDIATAISLNFHLQELDIGVNKFTSQGAIKIAKALQKISTLTKLYINHNNITDEAAEDIGMAINYNTALQDITIFGNMFHRTTVIAISNHTSNVTVREKIVRKNSNA